MTKPQSTRSTPSPWPRRVSKLRQKELRRLARDGEIDPPTKAHLSHRPDNFGDEAEMERNEKIGIARIRRADRKCRNEERNVWLNAPDQSCIIEELVADESEIQIAIVDARTRLYHEMTQEFRHVELLIRAAQLAGSATAASLDSDTDWGNDDTTVVHHTVTQEAKSAFA